MAEGTRNKAVEDQIKRSEIRMQELVEGVQNKMENYIKDNEQKMDNFMGNIDSKITALMRLIGKEKMHIGEESITVDKTPLLPTPIIKGREEMETRKVNSFQTPRVELPFFEGNNPRGWLRKCEKFFLVNHILEDQKIEVVEMYLEGKVEIWYHSMKLSKGKLLWGEFCEMLCRRFEEKGGVDVVEEFNKLMQDGSVIEYQEKFEELRSLMLITNPRLSETYFISSFISGLKAEIKPVIKMFKPTSILETYELAILQEQLLDINNKRSKNYFKTGMEQSNMGQRGGYMGNKPKLDNVGDKKSPQENRKISLRKFNIEGTWAFASNVEKNMDSGMCVN